MDQGQWVALIAAAMVLGILLPGMMRFRGQGSTVLRFIAAWLAIAAVIALLYRVLGP